MNRYYNLLTTIAQEYNIQRGNQESEISWQARIIYSLLSQTAYASLLDLQDDLTLASILHFKARITETLSSLLAMYPELNGSFSVTDNTLMNEIYDVFLSAGCIYHEPNRIVPCSRTISNGEKYCLLRGQALGEKKYISGAGNYLPINMLQKETKIPVENMFCLQKKTLSDSWTELVEKARFKPLSSNIKLLYMRNVPPYSTGYWTDEEDLSGEISLARTVVAGERIYYLYKTIGEETYVAQLPNWMTEEYKYRDVSVACLSARKTLPCTYYHRDGEIINLRIGYLFPPAILNLIKLYSWPTAFRELPRDFNRVMSVYVFDELKIYLSKIGYRFEEE